MPEALKRKLDLGILDQTNTPLNVGLSYTGPWLPVEGFSKVACEWVSAGGATITVSVDESFDAGATQDRTTSAGTAGANGPATPSVVQLAAGHVRLRAAVSVANATTLKVAMVSVS